MYYFFKIITYLSLNILFISFVYASNLIADSKNSLASSGYYSRDNTQKTNNDVHQLLAHRTRIVSLAPNLTEIVYALKLEKNLVGNTFQCNYPEEASKIYKIGNYINPNLERILIAKPEFVLATEGNPRSLVNKIEQEGIKVIETNPKTVEELSSSIIKISEELGSLKKGQQIADQIKTETKKLKKRVRLDKKNFLLVIQFDPIYSTSNNTLLGDIFKLTGYKNIVGGSKIKYPLVPLEYLIKNKPDIIFASETANFSYDENLRYIRSKISEIYNGNSPNDIKIILLPKDIFARAGPRIINALKFLESI